MKVLRKGQKNKKFIKTCPYCECVFEYDLADTTLSYEVIRYGIRCPQCGGQLYAQDSDRYTIFLRLFKIISNLKLKLYNLWKQK